MGDAAARHVQADAEADVLELGAVFRPVDCLSRGADHLHAELVEHARIGYGHRGIEAGLPAESRQKRVGTLLGDDLGHRLGSYRLDVRPVGELRIGHDRGRIGVNQNNTIILLTQGFTRLRAGVVELAALPDNYRTRADEHDGF